MAGECGSHLVWRLGMRHGEQIRVLAIDDDCISLATFDDQTRGEFDRAPERRDGRLRPEADAAPDVVDKPPFLNEAAISCSFAHFVEC